MEYALNNDNTSLLKLSLSIQEYNKGKIDWNEFIYKDKIYDVKSINIAGNKVELLVLNDTKEESIIQKIKVFTQCANQSNSQLPKQLTQLFSLDYLVENSEFTFYISSKIEHENFYISHPTFSNFQEVVSPPPETV